MSSIKDALRAAALKTRAPASKIVSFEGNDYEVRAPTVQARGNILRRAGIIDDAPKAKPGAPAAPGANKQDPAALQVAAVIACTFVPGTDERVFDEADFAALLVDPAGGVVDALSEPALEMLKTASDRDAAKNG